jgi:hypothetical protein
VPVCYFYLFFDLDLLDLIPQETILNKKKMQNMASNKRASITDWSPPTLADIRFCIVIIVLSIVINMGLHLVCDITDYFSKTKCHSFLDVFPEDEFHL